jgi:type IV pilus assembly protein PilB
MDPGNTLAPQDGHLVIDLGGHDRNFRVATMPVREGEKIVLRLVQPEFAFSRLDQLGMSLQERRFMDEILNSPAGLILVAGPVGSGKTTTLYSCLNCMNLFSKNVMTIEDPVEYELPGATQSQVNIRAHLTFAAGLRSILRQDPDVIMVGEIRDDETAEVAVRAAMAGQKVLSTIHANSAVHACTSLVLTGVRPSLVAHAIAGVVYQQLVRKVCDACAQGHAADDRIKKQLGFSRRKHLRFQSGRGCPNCMYTGTKGRTGAFEILRATNEFRHAFADDASAANLEAAAKRSGLLPLQAHAQYLVAEGIVPPTEVLALVQGETAR